MSLWAVVPVKSLHLGKSRLAGVLSPEARAGLMADLLVHVLGCLREVTAVSRTIVISRDPVVHHLAVKAGADVLPERLPLGLNSAVMQAATYARSQQAESILVLPADLPLLQVDDLWMMVGARRDEKRPLLAICPNQTNTGTNGLLLHHMPANFKFQYGENSFEKHIQESHRHQMNLHIVEAHGLSFDLDTEEDWQWMQTHLSLGQRTNCFYHE
jgi:2-phospho-L-lactate guanylyltransferase